MNYNTKLLVCDECDKAFIKSIDLNKNKLDDDEELEVNKNKLDDDEELEVNKNKLDDDEELEEYIRYKQEKENKCPSCILYEYLKSCDGCEHRLDGSICMMCKLWDEDNGYPTSD